MAESSKNTFRLPVPVFRVKDVGASIAYYLQALGFETAMGRGRRIRVRRTRKVFHISNQ